jgi:hypothetical protein
LALAALPPSPIADDVSFGVEDVPPTPSEDAEVPPAAALPPEPPVALVLLGVVDAAPEPTVDADIPPAAPALPDPGEAAIAEPARKQAAIALTAMRQIIG